MRSIRVEVIQISESEMCQRGSSERVEAVIAVLCCDDWFSVWFVGRLAEKPPPICVGEAAKVRGRNLSLAAFHVRRSKIVRSRAYSPWQLSARRPCRNLALIRTRPESSRWVLTRYTSISPNSLRSISIISALGLSDKVILSPVIFSAMRV